MTELPYNQILSSLTQEETNLLIKAGKRSSIVCGYDFKSLIYFSFRFVKETIPDLLGEGKIIELIELGLKEKNVPLGELNHKELVSFVLWIKDELDEIAKLEQDNLSRPPKPEMIACGIERFDIFGARNVVYGLCKTYPAFTLDYVWNQPYEEIFNLQLHGKVDSEFNEALNNYYKKKK